MRRHRSDARGTRASCRCRAPDTSAAARDRRLRVRPRQSTRSSPRRARTRRTRSLPFRRSAQSRCSTRWDQPPGQIPASEEVVLGGLFLAALVEGDADDERDEREEREGIPGSERHASTGSRAGSVHRVHLGDAQLGEHTEVVRERVVTGENQASRGNIELEARRRTNHDVIEDLPPFKAIVPEVRVRVGLNVVREAGRGEAGAVSTKSSESTRNAKVGDVTPLLANERCNTFKSPTRCWMVKAGSPEEILGRRGS